MDPEMPAAEVPAQALPAVDAVGGAKKSGGSIGADLTNIALPFGLMFAKHSLQGYMKKNKGEKASPAKKSPRSAMFRRRTIGGDGNVASASFPDAPAVVSSPSQDLPMLGGRRRRSPKKHSPKKHSPRRRHH
jgi:hypothetical protein